MPAATPPTSVARMEALALAAIAALGDDVLAAEVWRRRWLSYRAAAVSAAGQLRGLEPLVLM
jgi:hypothetical protein